MFDGYCGTVGFTAPEVVNKRVNKTKQGIDMWALGATILWLAGSEMDKKKKYTAQDLDTLVEEAFPRETQSDAFDFVRKCLRHKASARLSAEQAILHPWIANLPKEVPEEGPSTSSIGVLQNLTCVTGPWLDEVVDIPNNCSIKHEDKRYLLELGIGPARELVFCSED
ncbi:hypothetical protein FRC16_005618 [Serendipita sp. 398]|nr:hypothetical protein FRC16_005618 [Serendipita sp. 398]